MKNFYFLFVFFFGLTAFSIENADFTSTYNTYKSRITEYEKNYPDSALIYVEKALQLADIDKHPNKKIRCLFQKAKFEFLIGRYFHSVLTAQKADSLLQYYPNDELQKEVLYRLAEGFEYTGRLAQAMKAYEECFNLAESTNDFLIQVRLNLKFGDMHNAGKEYVFAIEKYLLAAQQSENIKKEHPAIYFLSWYEYFKVYSINPLNYPEEEITEKCAQITDFVQELAAYPLPQLKDKYQDLKRRCLLQENNISDIQKINLETIATIESKSSNSSFHFRKFLLNGEIALIQNKLNLAETYFQKAHKVADQSNNFHMRILIFSLEKKLYEQKGDYRKALEYYKADEKNHIELTKNKRLENFSKLENRIRDLEKTRKAKLLQKDKELLSTRNRTYLLALFFLMILAGLLFYLNMKTGQKNQIIAKQNQILGFQKTELQQLNATKDKIFSIIGHDLRKPSLAFRGIEKKIDYLLDAKDYDTLKLFGQQLDNSSKSMDGLLNNVLYWSLTQSQVLTLTPTELQLPLVIEETLSIFEERIQAKQLTIKTDIPPTMMVFVDPQVLKSTLVNLVDNAIKFSNIGNSISISADEHSTSNQFLLKIEDQGIGMNEAQLGDVFKLKQNKSTAGTHGEKGTGLGLHLVKELVELSKGTIDVESQVNGGTRFSISFP